MESTKSSTLKILLKDPRAKVLKQSKVFFYQTISAKTLHKAQRKKKKDRRNYGQDRQERQSSVNSLILAARVKVLKLVDKKKKKKGQMEQDISQIKYYNSDKKSHFASTCLELPKN